jgi:hypothetical protein
MHRSYGQLSKFSKGVKTHLVRENEGKFYFVSCFGIPTTTQDERTWGTSRNGRDKTERRHCWTEDGWCQGGLGNSRLGDETPETYPSRSDRSAGGIHTDTNPQALHPRDNHVLSL